MWMAAGAGKGRLATLRRRLGASIYGILSDESLAWRARAGDHAAFDALVARYRERLHAMARASLGDMDQAAEALQEAMVAAFRDVRSSGRSCAPGLWLYLHTFRAVLGRMNVPAGIYTFENRLAGGDAPRMPKLRPAAPALAGHGSRCRTISA
jgi:RNA polymerase sigma-70 factor (ECF subfamily)